MAQRTRETHGTRHTRFTRNKRYEQASTCGRSLFTAEEDLRTCQKGGEGRPPVFRETHARRSQETPPHHPSPQAYRYGKEII